MAYTFYGTVEASHDWIQKECPLESQHH